MKSISRLDISSNLITEFPDGITSESTLCSTLQHFDSSGNQLTSYPYFLRHCKSLNTIKLAKNGINMVPNHIRTCASTLRYLDLDSCNLKNLPAALTQCCLNDLKISGNPFPTPVRVNNEIYKERFSKRIPALRESCVKSIIRHGLQPTRELLPETLLNYVGTAQNCKVCFKLVLESGLVCYQSANLKSFSSTFTLLPHPPVITTFLCSEACFKTLCQGKSVVPAKLYFQRWSS